MGIIQGTQTFKVAIRGRMPPGVQPEQMRSVIAAGISFCGTLMGLVTELEISFDDSVDEAGKSLVK